MSGSEESVQSQGGSETASAQQRLNVRDFGLTDSRHVTYY